MPAGSCGRRSSVNRQSTSSTSSRRAATTGGLRPKDRRTTRGSPTRLVTWPTDECSPAGIAVARSYAFLGALQGQCVFAVRLDGSSTGKPRALFAGDYGRVRTVAAAPDGSLWVTTSNTDGRATPGAGDDRILRVTL
ncbi:MAG: PQQ-dependent sugar dehydrogenase [Nocardioidaceae bacterium]